MHQLINFNNNDNIIISIIIVKAEDLKFNFFESINKGAVTSLMLMKPNVARIITTASKVVSSSLDRSTQQIHSLANIYNWKSTHRI